jgi:ubiquinol-cytochrome c reductase cytochrome b subunit
MFLRSTRARWGAKGRQAAVAGFEAADARLPVAEGGRALLRKAFPDHWSFLLGELALYSFVMLVLTGVYLTLFFHPSMTQVVYDGAYRPLRGVPVSEAYASTLGISFEVRGGLLVRQIHHWGAVVFVAAITLHLLRVFFTGAFRKPREVNWTIGVTLFLLALLEGFCGYSLPDDLLSGTGLRTAQGIVLSIPVVGTYLQFFVFGGEFPGHEIIPRLYVTHILLVPGLLIALVTVHLILVFYLKHTQWAGPGRNNRNVVGRPMYPQFTARSAGLSFMVFGLLAVMGGLAQINPVWNYGPYRADVVSTDSQPDWYVGFLEGALRLMPPFETNLWGHTISWNVLVPTLVLPALLFLVLYAYPFFERWVTGDREEHHLCDRPRNRPVRTGLGVAGIVFYVVLLVAAGNDVWARIFDVSLNGMTWWLRILLVVAPVAAFMATRRVCRALQEHDRERLEEGDESGEVYQSVEGTLEETKQPLTPGERYRLAAREMPRPLQAAEGAGRGERLRAAVSGWYYRDREELPVPTGERPEVRGEVAAESRREPGGEQE